MKIITAAIALAFAMPAAAQTAPAGHHGQAGADHAQHARHGQQAPADSDSGHAERQDHAMCEGDCADRDGNGRMDCCDRMAAAGKVGACEHGRQQTDRQPAQPQPDRNR